MGDSSATDLEMGCLNSDTTSAQEVIKEFGVFLDRTTSMVQMLKEANKELNSATESSSIKEIKGRMENDMDQVGKMAHHMNKKLNRIFQSVLTPILNNLSNGRGYSVTLPLTTDPSTMSMIRALKIKFKDRENDLKNLPKTIWEEYLQVVQRRAFTVAGVKLSVEVARAMHTGSVVQMFASALQGISPEQNFAEMAALVETREKLDKALNKVQKLAIRARSTDEDLRDEMAANDQLLDENDGLFAVAALGLVLLFCFSVVFLGVTSA